MNKKLIERSVIALATCRNNKPHVIPIACAKVVGKNIVITDNFMKRTKENIKKNKNVELTFWKNDKTYNVDGKAAYYNNGKWLDFVKKMKENKGLPAKGAIIIKTK
jgi:uncharacterized pyridoxamine 5'-phosphate oxidase family protein